MAPTDQTALLGRRKANRFSAEKLGSEPVLAVSSLLLRPALLVVWAVWGLNTLLPFLIVWKQGTSFAWSDDWSMVPAITGAQPVSLEWLWAQHNEHRIAIPKLFFVGLVRLSHGDFRWEIFGNIIVLSAVSALLLATLYRIRGRQSIWDAFIPLMLLSTGQSAMFWGFEFQFVSGTVLACAFLALMLWQGPQFRGPAAFLACGCLLCLPFVGGNGLLYVPVLTLWLFVRGYIQLRGTVRRECSPSQTPFPTTASTDRFYGALAIATTIGAALLCVAYFIHYQQPAFRPKAGLLLAIKTAGRVLSSSFGWKAAEFQPYIGFATALVVSSALGWTLWQALTLRDDWSRRVRAIDLSAFVIAVLMVIAAVGYSRGGMWNASMNSHYSSLASPALIGTYFILSITIPAFLRVPIQAALLFMMAMLDWTYFRVFHASSFDHRIEATSLSSALHAHTSSATVANQHIDKFFYENTPQAREIVASGLKQLRDAGFSLYGAPEAEDAKNTSAK